MRLQAIEIKGFKSFYHKTRIEFPEGIISIVGPNGSGKSNILDAFRWVLGEQSVKNLRGDKMDDVIFSGTKRHKQANHCEVEIILNNEDRALDIDFTEVSIKRKTYRDGDTKYYINGRTCRLKDIKELFLDSGVGKEGYSIISQGKIDEIINQSSVQRRKLLEEASGIARYRYKKEESEKMIDESKENLSRLEDIFFELEKQVKPLEEQKQKALKYREISENLKKADINLMLQEYQKVNESTKADRINTQKIISKIAELETQIEINNQETARLGVLEEEHKSKIQNLKNQQHEINFKKNDLSNKILRHKEKIELKNEVASRSIAEQREQKAKQQELQNQQMELAKEQKDQERQIQSLEKEETKISREIEETEAKTKEIGREIGTIQDQFEKKKQTQNDKKSKIQFLEENQKWLELQREENQIKTGKLKADQDELQASQTDLKKQIQETKETQKELLATKEIYLDATKETENKIELLQNRQKEKNQERRDAAAKYQMYQKLEAEMDGFNKSVKTVMSNHQLPGILDVVSNIIKTEKKYERAIEIALGASMQHIITKDSAAAKQAVEYLKQTKSGRATFIPLDTAKGSKLNLAGILLASDVVQSEDPYKNILLSLLGRTLIAENMDKAIQMAKKFDHKYRIVTLDGELFSPGGSITGGHYLKNSEILSRKRIIKTLEEEIKTLETQQRQIEAELLKIQGEKNGLDTQLQATNMELDSLNETLQRLAQKEIEANSQAGYLASELKNLENENKHYYEKRQSLESEIHQLKNEYQKESQAQGDESAALEARKTEAEDLARELARKHGQKNDIKLKKLSLLNKIDNLHNDQQRILTQMEEAGVRIEEYKKEQTALFDEIRELERQVEESHISLQLCDVELDESLIESEEIEKELKKTSENLRFFGSSNKNLEDQRLKLIEEKYKQESKLERITVIKEQITERLKEEYELEIEQALAIENVETSKEIVTNLRYQLNQLGTINQNAVEEYELIAERYETYKTQIDDLSESIVELEKIIKKLEKDMASDFKKYFAIINHNFGEIFAKLFGGGEAHMSLADETDVLNTDIELFAQPPGKKLKSISVLSGGEKSLMGIALLFAIQMTKPAPFCILDEIDAALDDANISRFNVFLKELSSEIQFVTITHRRGTMETSDYIYGVTMQDKGVSHVVSVKFEDAQAYIEQ